LTVFCRYSYSKEYGGNIPALGIDHTVRISESLLCVWCEQTLSANEGRSSYYRTGPVLLCRTSGISPTLENLAVIPEPQVPPNEQKDQEIKFFRFQWKKINFSHWNWINRWKIECSFCSFGGTWCSEISATKFSILASLNLSLPLFAVADAVGLMVDLILSNSTIPKCKGSKFWLPQ